MRLDPERSRTALQPLAARLGLSWERLSEGVVQVANVQMARALRRVSVERGHDPRRFCLAAFGGGGPLHACDLAEEVGIPTVLIPRYPGILSALGMLLSDLRKEYSRTLMQPVAGSLSRLEAVFQELEGRARHDLQAEGVIPELLVLERRLETRYRGQSYELSIPAASLEPEAVRAAFHEAHRQRFGYASEGAACEVVNVQVRAIGRIEAPPLPFQQPEAAPAPPRPAFRQPVLAEGAWRDCPVYEREGLTPGQALAGPALLTQEDTTTWIPPGWAGRVDGWYNVLVTPAAEG